MSAHECHAVRCTTPVPPKMFMCRKHWFMVPAVMQARIWATYRPGQERTKDPSPEYLDAARAAWQHVATLEGFWPPKTLQAGAHS
jgi:hypothetical protein